MINYFFQGIALGISIASVVGPTCLLCIQRTINYGFWSGAASICGEITVHALYGSIGVLGLQSLSNFLIDHQLWFKVIGGSFLIYLGLKAFLSKPSTTAPQETNRTLLRDYLSMVALTFSNPITILFYISVFATLSNAQEGSAYGSILLLMGILSGAFAYGISLMGIVAYIRHKLSNKILLRLSQISALILMGLGSYSIVSAWL